MTPVSSATHDHSTHEPPADHGGMSSGGVPDGDSLQVTEHAGITSGDVSDVTTDGMDHSTMNR